MTHKTLFKKRRACPGQDRVLTYIANFKILYDGNSPSYAQIAQGLHLHKSTVYIHVKHLIEQGKLSYDDQFGFLKLIGGQYVPPRSSNERLN